MESDAAALRDQGQRLIQEGDLDGAARCLQEALAGDPLDGRIHGLLGICHARRGDLVSAVGALEEAARLQPGDAAASYNLAVGLYQAKRYPEARGAAERALSLDAGHSGASQLLARLDAAASAIQEAPPGGEPTGASTGFAMPVQPAATGAETAGGGAEAAAPPRAGGAEGLRYQEPAATAERMRAPGTGLRLLRGWLWGTLLGQAWTALTVFWSLLQGELGRELPPVIILVIVFAVVFGAAGALIGLVVAAANTSEPAAAWIGVGMGMVLLGLESALGNFHPINALFYFFTGRLLGSAIWGRVQKPVPL